jgi:hypothetical protein
MRDILTIDIEGDGISNPMRDKLFPKFGHFDPDTIPWCISMCSLEGMKTYVCKLPSVGRNLGLGISSNFHEAGTSVPSELNGYQITEYEDRARMIFDTLNIILQYLNDGKKVYFKAFWDPFYRMCFYYDRVLLYKYYENLVMDRLKDNDELRRQKLQLVEWIVKRMRGVCIPKGYWNQTPKQGSREKLDKDVYIARGIMHNIADTEQLFQLIQEGHYFEV